MQKVRITMEVSEELEALLKDLAHEEGVTPGEIIERGFKVVRVFREQIRLGRTHLGFVVDRTRLGEEIIGILDNVASARRSELEEEGAQDEDVRERRDILRR